MLNMNKILHYFKQPFPYTHKKWMIVVIPTVWVFLFGMVLKPMGFGREGNTLPVVLACSLVTAIASGIVGYIFPLIFKKYYDPQRWTKGKFWSVYISIVTIIAPILFVMSYFINARIGLISTYTPVAKFIFCYLIVLFIGVFPTAVIYFFAKNSWMESRVKEAMEANKRGIHTVKYDSREMIVLCGNTRESVTLPLYDFLYAEVLRNYVAVYYHKGDKVESKSLRVTLTQIMESLQNYPQIVRCHRAFMVNISNVEYMKYSKSYYLTLKDIDIQIPVSRSYIKSVREILNH